ncbi:MAG: GNAT family N-acetyltransferase [Dehalococcoidia bacterium]
MKLNIRTMTIDDKPAVMQILKTTPEFTPAEVVVAEEVLDIYLHDPSGPDYKVLVAEIGSSIKGYVCYGPTPLTDGTWDMYWVAVAPGEQGRGIGGALFAAAEEKMKKARGRLILIETSSKPEYEKTRRFHERQGYELVTRIPDFYSVGDDRLTFQKRLPQS